MILGQVFSPESINIDLQSDSKDEVFEELVEKLVEVCPGLDRAKILQALIEREQKMSTGIFPGIAVPHARTNMVDKVYGVIGVSKKGIDYESLDNKPVHLFFMLLSPVDDCEYHLRVITQLSQLLKIPGVSEQILAQKTEAGVYSVICKYEENFV
ncbi:MAG: PTS sugar transporter subunit IIA [Treponemataceae bacterium]|nr:PTS sugar transporter subunit IIA [Treponemataceae bacterium]